ncbi:NUDIX domain-containing protein [Fulvivirgaceae bacterium PWU4]|uniref:NUDIX domain-containing protein n=1 Tax=Chryseosolibacter histidini TaxID=2782349 RepID=A0AAP2GI77_9BACT|nr:NUDIX domain-containing protein [Chryseosolibacter histidini]MBT1696846.1 NUDIX domain-containing protein [Chryseosolibacter histidini]
MPSDLFSSSVIDAVSIDCLIFGFRGSGLDILLIKHGEGISKGKWALPGGWIQYNEDVDEAAGRLLKSLTGVSNIYLEQLRAFGDVSRYPEKRVITIAYYALVNTDHYALSAGFTASDVQWFNVHEVPKLPYDHNRILDFGLRQLKHKVRHEPIGFNLLPKKFTLHQIQQLYEAILEMQLDKPNFRRKLLNMNLLVPCHEKQKDVSHRAASLYRFDKKIYDQLTEKGLSFEL